MTARWIAIAGLVVFVGCSVTVAIIAGGEFFGVASVISKVFP